MNESEEYSFYENFSAELKYLERVRGPKYLPLTLVVPVTLAYVVIFVTGFAGNIITCIVIWRNPTTQTATNYYLFNLAVSDLLFLVLGKFADACYLSPLCSFFGTWNAYHVIRNAPRKTKFGRDEISFAKLTRRVSREFTISSCFTTVLDRNFPMFMILW